MALLARRRPVWPRSPRLLRLPPRTARLRLTMLYAGMFLALGTAVIVVIDLVFSGSSAMSVTPAAVSQAAGAPGTGVAPTAHGTLVRPELFPGIQAGLSRQQSADVSRLLATSWVVLAVTAVASCILGWFIAGRVLRPLRAMTATARTISAGNLHQRLALSGPDDEFKLLGDTVDELLARLEAAFEAQRRFVANASHELRTPLTLERTLLQVALADPEASAATLRATCEELLACGRDQERLIEALLTLASSERGLEQRQRLDLAALAARELAARGPETPRGVESRLEPAPVRGDPALLGRLIANLLDNAIHHNDARGVVEVRTGADPAGSWLSVSNTGPLVPAGEVERLFEPFQRLEQGRGAVADGGEHHGLGLSIVRAIATAHGGTVSARPREGGGLAVEVRLPG